jgi:hypothetical protein
MPSKKFKLKSPFTGRWRIVSMSALDDEYIDEEEEGYFEFTGKSWGQFHFGNVQGQMDCFLTTRNGEPLIEWSWDGNAEMDAAQGRGWAMLKGKELHGMIFFHGSDNSEFIARRTKTKPARKRK